MAAEAFCPQTLAMQVHLHNSWFVCWLLLLQLWFACRQRVACNKDLYAVYLLKRSFNFWAYAQVQRWMAAEAFCPQTLAIQMHLRLDHFFAKYCGLAGRI
jgi:hypothetical protein